MRAWKVLDRGEVPVGARTISYTCQGCGVDALLPVVGSALAQVGSGLVFDRGKYAIPTAIQCRHCRRRYEV